MSQEEIEEMVGEIVTPEKVLAAIEAFDPDKGAGPDGIKPIVLQHLNFEALLHLTDLYKASLALGYVPTVWRQSNCVFLSKSGKAD